MLESALDLLGPSWACLGLPHRCRNKSGAFVEFLRPLQTFYRQRPLTAPKKIERFSDVSNILAYLRSNLSPEDNQTHQLKMCISKLSKIIEAENQESDNCKKLMFLRDQLALINKTPKRYSSSFIWQALTWLKHPHRCIPCSKMMAFWHCQALVTWNRFLVRFPLKLDCPPEFVHT